MENTAKRSRTTRIINKVLKLTSGEKLLLWRRRIGWNQKQAAKYYAVSVYNYKLAEYDKLKHFPYKISDFKLLPPLHDYEKCLIHRKRSGLTQPAAAKQIGYGRYWLRLQETGKVSCEKLLVWWNEQ